MAEKKRLSLHTGLQRRSESWKKVGRVQYHRCPEEKKVTTGREDSIR